MKRITPEIRAAILSRKGQDTQMYVAIEFDVSDSTVWAIWNPEAAKALNKRRGARRREKRRTDPEYAKREQQLQRARRSRKKMECSP